MPPNPEYSVIIVSYNGRADLAFCLDSLRRYAPPGRGQEIIVVDNASQDGTADFLRDQADLTALCNDANLGFSKACNAGARRARGDFVVFLNPDTMVSPSWLENMRAHFADTAVGAVGPLSTYVAGLQQVSLHTDSDAGPLFSADPERREELIASLAAKLAKDNRGKAAAARLLIGFCLMMPRALYHDMGGMDEELFLGNDDLDLSWRLRLKGHRLLVARDAFVFHSGQKSFKTRPRGVVDALVRESTDALYRKLARHYGGPERVPPPEELWGISWFKPSQVALAATGKDPAAAAPPGGETDGAFRPEAEKSSTEGGSRHQALSEAARAWLSWTHVIYLQGAPGIAAHALSATLASLPAAKGLDVLLLNCTGRSLLPPGRPAILRELDLGADCLPERALTAAVRGVERPGMLFCVAGVQYSAWFNFWFTARPAGRDEARLLPVRAETGEGPSAEGRLLRGAMAFACPRETLLRCLRVSREPDAAPARAFFATLAERLAALAPPPDDAQEPALLWRGACAELFLPPEPNHSTRSLSMFAERSQTRSWVPVAHDTGDQSPSGKKGDLSQDSFRSEGEPAAPGRNPRLEKAGGADPFAIYPDSLQPFLREARCIALAGKSTGLPPLLGPARGIDLNGYPVALEDQDLLIVRVSAEMMARLDERLANFRRQLPRLRRMLAIWKDFEPGPERDAPAQVRAALWRAGFVPLGESPYLGFAGKLSSGGKVFAGGGPGIQFVTAPRSREYALERLVSIIILGFNQVEYTRQCIESIRRHTRQRHELILVDNGSTDGTADYFQSVPGAKVIVNPQNLGVARGWNQGLRAAEGDYLLIFNNDTLVTPNWLENMVRLAECSPDIGLVGPRSNNISGPQMVPEAKYGTIGEMRTFAGQWQHGHDLSAGEFHRITGFCLLIPRRVFEKVGSFDERFGKGNFEDDDYCVRARYRGYKLMIAHDSFVHHYGSISFLNNPAVDYNTQLRENLEKFRRKWSRGAEAVNDTVSAEGRGEDRVATAGKTVPRAGAQAPGGTQAIGRPGGAVKLYPDSGTVLPGDPQSPGTQGGDMPNGRSDLELAQQAYGRGDLEGARRLFLDLQALRPEDPEVFNGLGILRFHDGVPGEALQLFTHALHLAPGHEDAGRNILEVLDSVEPGERESILRELAEAFPKNPVLSGAKQPTEAERPADAEGEPWRARIEGFIRARRFPEAVDAVQAALADRRDHDVCLNYLGVIALELGDKETACRNFELALEANPRNGDALLNRFDCLMIAGRHREAAAFARETLAGNAGEAAGELRYGLEKLEWCLDRGREVSQAMPASRAVLARAEALLQQGKCAEAKALIKPLDAADPGDFQALNLLGVACFYLGENEEALAHFLHALDVHPGCRDALANACDAALATERSRELLPALDRILEREPRQTEAAELRDILRREGGSADSYRNHSELKELSRRVDAAEKKLREEDFPGAIRSFLEVLDKHPENPRALSGLGIAAFAKGEVGDAFGLFRQALTVNPLDQDTLLNFWEAARRIGRAGEVLPVLRQALEAEPGMRDVRAVVAAGA